MSRRASSRFAMLAICNVLFLCVLGFYRSGTASPQPGESGLPNPSEQRLEMVRQLREMNRLLAEQNELLRSGQLRVKVVAQDAR